MDEHADVVHRAGRRLMPKVTKRRASASKKKNQEIAKRKIQQANRAREEKAAQEIDKMQRTQKNWDNFVYNTVSQDCRAESLNLKLGEKNDRDFRCGGGGCVPLKALCNGVSNCMDSSDEADCELTTIQANIRKQMKENGAKPAFIETFAKDLQKGLHEIPTKAKKTSGSLHSRIDGQGKGKVLTSHLAKSKNRQASKKTEPPSLEEDDKEERSHPTAKEILDGATMPKRSPTDKAEHRRRTTEKRSIPLHIRWTKQTGLSDADGQHPTIRTRIVHRKEEGEVPDDIAAPPSPTEQKMMRRE